MNNCRWPLRDTCGPAKRVWRRRGMRLFVVVWCFGPTFCFLSSADTLYLRAGEQELGRLEKMTADTVVFSGRDGEKTLPKSEVNRIQLQRARQFDDVERAAQITDPELKTSIERQPSEKDYPADGAVTLFQRKSYDLTQRGIVKETVRTITKILRQRGEDAGTTSVWYYEDTDTPEIDFALTVTPDGRVLHLSDTALKEESVYARFPDYRRFTRYRFASKEPRPGSILDTQFTVVRKRDTVLEPFYAEELFGGDTPIMRKEVSVLVPGDGSATTASEAAARFVAFNIDGKGADIISSEVAINERGRVLTWRLKRPQPGIVEEPMMPPKKSFIPTLTLGVPATWRELVATYASTLAAVPALSDSLKAKAAELADQGGAPAIHDFVARTIRTAPVPHPQFRMTPHSPDETVRRGLANELDKNFLYASLLEAAGIDCTFALVRDRMQGPLADAVPSLRPFNRSAVYLNDNGTFATTVTDLLPLDVLPGELQGVPALIIAPDSEAPVETQRRRPEQELENDGFWRLVAGRRLARPHGDLPGARERRDQDARLQRS